MHPCQEDEVAIGRMVVYYAQAVEAFSAEIKYWHSMRAASIVISQSSANATCNCNLIHTLYWHNY